MDCRGGRRMHGRKTQALFGLTAGLLLLPGGFGIVGMARAAEGDKAAAPREKLARERVVLVDDQGKSTTLDTLPKRLLGGYLGVGLLDLTPELRTHFGVPEEAGVMVS